MAATFAVMGAGSWGTAVAVLLAQNLDHRVRLWCARPENAAALARDRVNARLLPGVTIPGGVCVTADPAEAADGAELWVTAVPTVYLRPTLARLAAAWPGDSTAVLSLTKGIENETFRRPTEIIAEVLGAERVAVLSGPSHAEEVARGSPASVAVASADEDLARRVQAAFNTERFRVYTNPDVIGVEVAGAVKNVMGIAAGICDGLELGDNAKSALMTRGLVEMARFGVALGADHATFYGLAGLGDLITTCVSPHGRNRRVGERLGRGETLADVTVGMAMVAEGVATSRSVYERARRMGVDVPVMTGVYRVLYEGYPPAAVVGDLMGRRPRSERQR